MSRTMLWFFYPSDQKQGIFSGQIWNKEFQVYPSEKVTTNKFFKSLSCVQSPPPHRKNRTRGPSQIFPEGREGSVHRLQILISSPGISTTQKYTFRCLNLLYNIINEEKNMYIHRQWSGRVCCHLRALTYALWRVRIIFSAKTFRKSKLFVFDKWFSVLVVILKHTICYSEGTLCVCIPILAKLYFVKP